MGKPSLDFSAVKAVRHDDDDLPPRGNDSTPTSRSSPSGEQRSTRSPEGERTSTPDVDQTRPRMIELNVDDVAVPRVNRGVDVENSVDRAHVDYLAESIASESGQLSPAIVVEKHVWDEVVAEPVDDDDAPYVVVCGVHRLRACRKLDRPLQAVCTVPDNRMHVEIIRAEENSDGAFRPLTDSQKALTFTRAVEVVRSDTGHRRGSVKTAWEILSQRIPAVAKVSYTVFDRYVKVGELLRDHRALADALDAGQVPVKLVEEVARIADDQRRFTLADKLGRGERADVRAELDGAGSSPQGEQPEPGERTRVSFDADSRPAHVKTLQRLLGNLDDDRIADFNRSLSSLTQDFEARKNLGRAVIDLAEAEEKSASAAEQVDGDDR